MGPPDPLDELRERVRAAQESAERVAGDARHAAEWSREQTRDELDALAAMLRSLRDVVPPELQQQVSEALRNVLLLLRAIIDYWVTRLEPAPAAREVDVEDIPVE
jgi:hypothetical protein